jgi:hypothetical protein
MDGTIINDEPWDIGTILPQESVIITYEMIYNPLMTPGSYHLSTLISSPFNISFIDRDNGSVEIIPTVTKVPDILPPVTYSYKAPLQAHVYPRIENSVQAYSEVEERPYSAPIAPIALLTPVAPPTPPPAHSNPISLLIMIGGLAAGGLRMGYRLPL